ncbi:hypothetical protein Loa_01435 [Legionella oakridgensis ATCC 33761 = DSM 21215]|uniref:Tetratricopeptide repeat protein n=1 Tax=Legionella oakridgensis ATCC 33761 = DSM 21215 TaxID=1268635 RepID=W0B8X0_9GAMM|nr:hypothetical protein Loa_01435 [Legionella oakridgensis ATCC 33761 = DSM 21215]
MVSRDHDNLFFEIAMAQAELGCHQYADALTRLSELQANYPDNYAALISYGQGLLNANKAEQAASLLLKGSRVFKEDLPLCQLLAQAQAAAHRKDYAYFTQAQCELMQGHRHSAMKQLKLAEKLSTKDHLLSARITAKIEEIKFLSEQ